jgi:hypothetical protein
MANRGEELGYKPAFSGTYGSVVFGTRCDGTEPAWDFWQGIGLVAKSRFATLFRMIADNPRLQIGNKRKFNQIDGPMWEFKSVPDQMRIFCFRQAQSWYLTSGFDEKKEWKIPTGEVDRAKEIVEDCMMALQRVMANQRRANGGGRRQ